MSMKKFLRHCSTSAVNLAEAFAHVSQAINEAATALNEATTRHCANSRVPTKTANTVNNTAKLTRNVVRHSTSWTNETMLLAVHEARLARVTSMVKDEYVDSLTEQEQEEYFDTGILPPAMEQEAKTKIAETIRKPPTDDDERWEREFLKNR